MSDLRPLSVSDLNRSARRLLEGGIGHVSVAGEISNYSRPRSGHWYFTLKDDQAQVRCAMFANRNRLAQLQPGNGMAVLLRGKVSLYEDRGEFQIIVEHMEAAGEGALRAAFEALRAKLSAEGLFNAERKRALPPRPRHLVIVTSPTGAALRDVLSVARRRFPLMRITLAPVAVQGIHAAPEITAALGRAALLAPDVLLITRGGGSLEDLFAFNTEQVARALAACPVPTVAAIGHETDVTISDWIADLRAPTPSAAAEMITPDAGQLQAALAGARRQLQQTVDRNLSLHRHSLVALRSRLLSPTERLQRLMQRADLLEQRLKASLEHSLERRLARLVAQARQLTLLHPKHLIASRGERLNGLRKRSRLRLNNSLHQAAMRLGNLARTLDAVSPLSGLERGLAVVTDATGAAIASANAIKAGDAIQVNFHDGGVSARVGARHPLPERLQGAASASRGRDEATTTETPG